MNKSLATVGFLALTLWGCAAYADGQAPLPEAKGNPIGYSTVAEARSALLARKDAESHTENGWLIVVIDSERTIWSFAPATDPSYPSAVERVITEDTRNTS